MPPTRGRAAAAQASAVSAESTKPEAMSIQPGELAPIVQQVLKERETRRSTTAALREARMKELFRLITIAQAEYEEASGRMAVWMAGEGAEEGEAEDGVYDEAWQQWRDEHKLVEGAPSAPIELPPMPVSKPAAVPELKQPTTASTSTSVTKNPTPVPSSSPLSEPAIPTAASPPASSSAPIALGAPPAARPKPVVDVQPAIVQSADVPNDVFPPKVAVAPVEEEQAGGRHVVPNSQGSRHASPVDRASSHTDLPQTIDPAVLIHQLGRYAAAAHPGQGIYVPRLCAAPRKRGLEYHPALYPPAGTGYLVRPPTPPGGDPLPLIGVATSPLTPEGRTLLPLEGEYAAELHPLPPAPPRAKRPRRERDRDASPPAVHPGPHLITSTSVQATIPPRTRTSRSSSPTAGAGTAAAPSKDGLLPTHGDGASSAGMAGVPVQVKHLDLYRLNASFTVNPVHRMLQRANKCVTSREWATAWAELKFLRAMERVETLKEENRWSFRQGKKFRGPVVPKSHWDYLLDEMRWMATDFREERKWKAAVAFELALAVQEWHRAPAEGEGSKAELSVGGRAWGNGGITSLLGRPGPGPSRAAANNDPRSGADGDKPLHAAADEVMVELEQREQEEEVAAELAVKQEEDDLAAWTQAKSKAASEVAVANASDEEDEDADGEVDDSMEVQQPGDVDMQALPEQPARPGADAATRQSRVITGASAGQTLVAEDDQVEPLDPALAKELRVSLVAAGPATTSYNPAALGPAEPSLEELFPDLTAYAPPVPPTDDRVEQRIDQSTSWASRLTHTSRLMDVRPVLVSTLQPSKNRHPSGRWDHIDDGTMYDDTFDHEEWKQSSTGPMSNSTAPIFGVKAKRHRHHEEKDKRDPGPPKPKQVEGRPALEWEENEDAALKELVEDYPRNWSLIADLFNSARITISTDERSPWDCYERWNIKFATKEERNPAIVPPPTANEDAKSAAGPPSAAPGISPAIPSAVPIANGQTTPGVPNADQPPLSPGAARRDAKAARLAKFEGSKKKVRVMCLKEAMRRIQKRRDLTNKKPANPRQVVQVHESHHPYLQPQNPPTPLELSFMQHEQVKAQQQQMEHMRLTQLESARRLQAQRQAQQAQAQAQANAGRMQQMQQQAQTQVQQVAQLTQAAQLQQAQQAQQGQAQMAGRIPQNGATGSPQLPNGAPMQAQGSQPNGQVGQPGMQAPMRNIPPEFNLSNLTPAQQQQMLTMLNGPNRQAAINALQNARLPNGAMRAPANGAAQPQSVPQTNSPVQVQNMMQQIPLALQHQIAAAAAQNRGATGSPANSQVNLVNSPQLQQGQPMQRPQSAASQHRQSSSPQTANGRPMSQQMITVNGVQMSASLYAAFMASTQGGNIANMTPDQKTRAFQMLQQSAQAQAAAQQAGQGGVPMPNPGTPVQMNGQ